MKKGLLLALGLTLVAVLVLPQMADAATPVPNQADIFGYTTASGPTTVTISAQATVWVLGSASIAMTKGVMNLSRGEFTPTQQTDAIVGDIVQYTVVLLNAGEDEILAVDFADNLPVAVSPGLEFCTPLDDPLCIDPTWSSLALGASGPLLLSPPFRLEDEPANPIRVAGGGLGNETILTYTAIVTP
jgi:uncharacterized repeat protein (TIGR01451 family)